MNKQVNYSDILNFNIQFKSILNRLGNYTNEINKNPNSSNNYFFIIEILDQIKNEISYIYNMIDNELCKDNVVIIEVIELLRNYDEKLKKNYNQLIVISNKTISDSELSDHFSKINETHGRRKTITVNIKRRMTQFDSTNVIEDEKIEHIEMLNNKRLRKNIF